MNLLEIFQDGEISDLLVSSTEPWQVVRAGKLESLSTSFTSEEELQMCAKELIRQNSGRLDLAKPYAEINLQSSYGNLRIHCILGGQCSTGTHISIRRHPNNFLTLSQLATKGSISATELITLKEILASKENFAIVGATGSGKTTLLRALLSEVTGERIITIEDSPELNLAGAVKLYVREANTEGFGSIDLQTLLKEAMRMRPDRLVVGEARGAELFVLLQALNTGHSGAGFTLHANGLVQATSRMMTLLCLSGLAEGTARQLIACSVDWVIELDSLTRSISRIERLLL
ncbi:MAG: ATPase, T2SS/T4P/T4SS family [Rhodoluna sp.]